MPFSASSFIFGQTDIFKVFPPFLWKKRVAPVMNIGRKHIKAYVNCSVTDSDVAVVVCLWTADAQVQVHLQP